MSNWTHAAGVIRIDALRIGDAPDPDFDELIGRELRFHDPVEVWMAAEEHPERFMPLGSEGSLTKAVWVNLSGATLCTNSLKDIHFVKNFNKTYPLTTSKEEHDQPKCLDKH